VQDFFGDYSRFAGTGAGEDELEAFAGGDGLGLRGVEGHSDCRLTGGRKKVVGKKSDRRENV
jgi:hypothetical protein